jgi:outer membrane protein OmpA-like peptidoglycan-associated protein
MKSIIMTNNIIRYLTFLGVAGIMAACATSHVAAPDTGQAQSKIQAAQKAGAQKYAPDQLSSANQKLKQAKDLVNQGDNKKASKLTRQASVDAELAMNTTRSKKAQEAIDQLKGPIQDLQEDVDNMKAKMTKRGAVLTFSSMLFNFDKMELQPGGLRTLSKLAQFLKKYPNNKVLIEGYTDNYGPKQYNQHLSQQRANSAKEALVNNGISANRIRTKGYGEQYPVATNSTVAGRQLNRRVAVVISKENEPVQMRGQQGMTNESDSANGDFNQSRPDSIEKKQSNTDDIKYN